MSQLLDHPMAVAPQPFFSTMTFLGFVLAAIPLPWHLEAWNTGTCLYMMWASLACLNNFVNSVVWKDNTLNVAPVWCDIAARFIIGANAGVPAASLCINRRLYKIATVQSVTISKEQKRRDVYTDLAIGLGIPVLGMILQYIPQGHRFDIIERIGCYPATYNTWVAFLLVLSWPLAIGCVSAVYCVLSIRAFARRRATYKQFLSSNNNLSASRYVRLMALAGVELLFSIPFSAFAVYLNVKAGVQPWISWADTHSNFSAVDMLPAVLWRLNYNIVIGFEMTRWAPVFCAFLFFAFFGFADEARKHYRTAYNSVAKRVGLSTLASGSFLTSSADRSASKSGGMSSVGARTMPVFVRRETTRKRDSALSFNDKLTDFSLSVGAFDDVKEVPYSPTDSNSDAESVHEKRLPVPAPAHVAPRHAVDTPTDPTDIA